MTPAARKELEMSIYDLLGHVHRKPGLFISELSIHRLHAFLTGYDAGLGHAGFILRDEIDFHRFHDWVACRLGFFESTSGWANMIRGKSASDKDAFEQFFVLLDEFRKEGR
jgi:hypothetical protein